MPPSFILGLIVRVEASEDAILRAAKVVEGTLPLGLSTKLPEDTSILGVAVDVLVAEMLGVSDARGILPDAEIGDCEGVVEGV